MEPNPIQLACQLSHKNTRGGPFGAVVVDNKTNKIIGQSPNLVIETFDPTAHAEVSAIRDACKNIKKMFLENCTIYSSCHPCPMCLAACYWAKVDKIVYAVHNDDTAKVGFDDSYIYREMGLKDEERGIEIVQDKSAFEAGMEAFYEFQRSVKMSKEHEGINNLFEDKEKH